MKHLCLLIMLVLDTCLLAGAQFIDGELYLEINLVTEPIVTITPKTNNPQITVSETDGLISHSFNSSITISIRNPEPLVHYAVLDYTEIVTETTDNLKEVVRDFFVWENSRLKIKKNCNTICQKVLQPKKRHCNMHKNIISLRKKLKKSRC